MDMSRDEAADVQTDAAMANEPDDAVGGESGGALALGEAESLACKPISSAADKVAGDLAPEDATMDDSSSNAAKRKAEIAGMDEHPDQAAAKKPAEENAAAEAGAAAAKQAAGEEAVDNVAAEKDAAEATTEAAEAKAAEEEAGVKVAAEKEAAEAPTEAAEAKAADAADAAAKTAAEEKSDAEVAAKKKVVNDNCSGDAKRKAETAGMANLPDQVQTKSRKVANNGQPSSLRSNASDEEKLRLKPAEFSFLSTTSQEAPKGWNLCTRTANVTGVSIKYYKKEHTLGIISSDPLRRSRAVSALKWLLEAHQSGHAQIDVAGNSDLTHLRLPRAFPKDVPLSEKLGVTWNVLAVNMVVNSEDISSESDYQIAIVGDARSRALAQLQILAQCADSLDDHHIDVSKDFSSDTDCNVDVLPPEDEAFAEMWKKERGLAKVLEPATDAVIAFLRGSAHIVGSADERQCAKTILSTIRQTEREVDASSGDPAFYRIRQSLVPEGIWQYCLAMDVPDQALMNATRLRRIERDCGVVLVKVVGEGMDDDGSAAGAQQYLIVCRDKVRRGSAQLRLMKELDQEIEGRPFEQDLVQLYNGVVPADGPEPTTELLTLGEVAAKTCTHASLERIRRCMRCGVEVLGGTVALYGDSAARAHAKLALAWTRTQGTDLKKKVYVSDEELSDTLSSVYTVVKLSRAEYERGKLALIPFLEKETKTLVIARSMPLVENTKVELMINTWNSGYTYMSVDLQGSPEGALATATATLDRDGVTSVAALHRIRPLPWKEGPTSEEFVVISPDAEKRRRAACWLQELVCEDPKRRLDWASALLSVQSAAPKQPAEPAAASNNAGAAGQKKPAEPAAASQAAPTGKNAAAGQKRPAELPPNGNKAAAAGPKKTAEPPPASQADKLQPGTRPPSMPAASTKGVEKEAKGVVADVKLNSKGLPMRPGSKACLAFLVKGVCPKGAACALHHPEKQQETAEAKHGKLQQVQRKQEALQKMRENLAKMKEGGPAENEVGEERKKEAFQKAKENLAKLKEEGGVLDHEASEELQKKEEAKEMGPFVGLVKFFSTEMGFGFVTPCGDLSEQGIEGDAWVHETHWGGFTKGDYVEFTAYMVKNGKCRAKDLKEVSEEAWEKWTELHPDWEEESWQKEYEQEAMANWKWSEAEQDWVWAGDAKPEAKKKKRKKTEDPSPAPEPADEEDDEDEMLERRLKALGDSVDKGKKGKSKGKKAPPDSEDDDDAYGEPEETVPLDEHTTPVRELQPSAKKAAVAPPVSPPRSERRPQAREQSPEPAPAHSQSPEQPPMAKFLDDFDPNEQDTAAPEDDLWQKELAAFEAQKSSQAAKDGWKRLASRSTPGVFYYFNSITGVNQVDPPPPWEVKTSRSNPNQKYYWNPRTGQASMEKPEV